jgi:radical SAM superfamily enzyme YgiQ (UPF0313 family)
LTLTTLAALVPEELGAEVSLYDEGIHAIPPDVDADLVGMTVITGTAPRAYEWAAHFRERGVPVVLGGPHVTLAPEDAQPHADAIVTGYAERTWPALLRDLAAGRLRPRYDMASDFRFDEPGMLPFPRRDLLPRGAYKTVNTIEATRGCVHDCRFCVVPSAWGRRPFLKPIGHVIDELRRMRARHAVFYDLNLIANRAYACELFEALAPLRLRWFGLASTLLDEELVARMARSGCRGLLIGFESPREDALADMRKGWNRPVRYPELIAMVHRHGIAINGTFVFGNDSDGPEVFDEVADFVLAHGIDLPRFAVLTPFPGTPLYRQLAGEDRILTRDWSLYDGQHVVFRPARLGPEELLAGHEAVWRRVYAWRGIARRLGHRVLRPLVMAPVVFAANCGYRHYAHNLSRFYTCTGGTI